MWPNDAGAWLPVMPGFRELAGQRQAAGLSQTEIAVRMGTLQSAPGRTVWAEASWPVTVSSPRRETVTRRALRPPGWRGGPAA